jgi:Ulp1 family protease
MKIKGLDVFYTPANRGMHHSCAASRLEERQEHETRSHMRTEFSRTRLGIRPSVEISVMISSVLGTGTSLTALAGPIPQVDQGSVTQSRSKNEEPMPRATNNSCLSGRCRSVQTCLISSASIHRPVCVGGFASAFMFSARAENQSSVISVASI